MNVSKPKATPEKGLLHYSSPPYYAAVHKMKDQRISSTRLRTVMK
jgi:hypothetical protein